MPIWTRDSAPGLRAKVNDSVMISCNFPSFRAPLVAAFRFFAWIAVALLALACLGVHAQPLAQPKWSELSRERQQALQPLAGQWDTLDNTRRKKWIVVADRYPAMKPEEQKRMQSRMADWARLTPEQRRVARENYQKSKSLPAEQKKAEWQQYQTLPEAQKQRLAATADERKPAVQKARQRESEGKVVAPSMEKKVRAADAPASTARPTKPVPPLPPTATPPATPAVASPPAAPAMAIVAPADAPAPAAVPANRAE